MHLNFFLQIDQSQLQCVAWCIPFEKSFEFKVRVALCKLMEIHEIWGYGIFPRYRQYKLNFKNKKAFFSFLAKGPLILLCRIILVECPTNFECMLVSCHLKLIWSLNFEIVLELYPGGIVFDMEIQRHLFLYNAQQIWISHCWHPIITK